MFVKRDLLDQDVIQQIFVPHFLVLIKVTFEEFIMCRLAVFVGTCIRTNEEPYGGCNCLPEYSGPTCSNDPCSPSPCLNGGHCIRKPDNQFYCQCRSKNKGVYCERKFILFKTKLIFSILLF